MTSNTLYGDLFSRPAVKGDWVVETFHDENGEPADHWDLVWRPGPSSIRREERHVFHSREAAHAAGRVFLALDAAAFPTQTGYFISRADDWTLGLSGSSVSMNQDFHITRGFVLRLTDSKLKVGPVAWIARRIVKYVSGFSIQFGDGYSVSPMTCLLFSNPSAPGDQDERASAVFMALGAIPAWTLAAALVPLPLPLWLGAVSTLLALSVLKLSAPTVVRWLRT